MVRRASLVAGALVVLASACATAPPSPEALRVDDLKIEGTKALREGDVTDKILTGDPSWIPWWVPIVGKVEWYEPNAWQADLRRITRFYEANGYYQAHIVDDVVTPTKPGHVKLLVRLREGEPARIASLRITGVPAEHAAAVLDELPVHEGDIFLEDRWLGTKGLIAARLRELGYAETVVTGEALVDIEAAKVDIRLEVAPGLRYRIGQIFVGTEARAKVPAKYLSQHIADDLRQTDFYSESALATAQARIFQLGVFSAVKVNRGAPEREAGRVPIVVDVREAPFRSVRLGGGLAGDLIRQEVRLVGEFTHRNLGLSRLVSKNSLLDRLTLKAKLGWAFLPTVWDVASGAAGAKHGPIARLLTEYEVPRFLGLRTVSLQTAVDLSRTLDNAFDSYGAESKVGVIWRPRPDLTVMPAVNVNVYLLNAPIGLASAAVSSAVGCPVLPAACVVAFLGTTIELDRRDSRLEAREGFYLALDVVGGLYQREVVTPFFKVTPEARGYLSLDAKKRFTLAGKLRVGTLVAPGNETPIVARYFSGGSLMRGFNQRRLSPLVVVPGRKIENGAVVDDPSNGATLPIGGSGLAELSLEARWNVWGDLVLAVFNDWGLVTEKPLGPETNMLNDLFSAVGIGARYRTPLGPIRLDFAFRLPMLGGPRTPAQSGAVPVSYVSNGGCFGLGNPTPTPSVMTASYSGAPEDRCSFHLSIGEAF
ncbi:MAG: BamA/TamA family outer membrane protein [Archangium sp.]|nr:BamA/TamA family outer membrane protein [Archangium sp.]